MVVCVPKHILTCDQIISARESKLTIILGGGGGGGSDSCERSNVKSYREDVLCENCLMLLHLQMDTHLHAHMHTHTHTHTHTHAHTKIIYDRNNIKLTR